MHRCINSENQYLPITVTSAPVQLMSMTDKLSLDTELSRSCSRSQWALCDAVSDLI